MTEFTVNSTVCGFVHKINGSKKGNKIIVDIDTPCVKVKKISHMEVPVMEILDIKNNYAMSLSQNPFLNYLELIKLPVK